MSREAGATQSDQIRPELIPGAFIKHGRQEQKVSSSHSNIMQEC